MNELVLRIGDALFGWLLLLPSDLALLVLAVGSSTVLAIVRRWTTDQDLLSRCAADKKRLRELIRAAKGRRDAEAVQRHRATMARVGLTQMRQEGRPLLAAIVPLAVLATWAFERMEFHPAAAGERISVVAHFPAASAGRLVHMVPQPGLACDEGWIREIRAVKVGGQSGGEAEWALRADAADKPHVLVFRHGRSSYEHPVLAGGRKYLPALLLHGDELLGTEVRLRQVKLLGIVPGIPALGMAPWMVAYILLVFAAFPAVKKCLRLK
jgi:uncharacterized membrane protein (DUF106 family)